MRESWWRIDTRTGSYQFFRRSRQLPVVITFDPELRLMHGLRLRKALVILFTIITHAKHDVKCWKNGGRYDPIGVGERFWFVGQTSFEKLISKMKILGHGESIQMVTEPIRWAILEEKHEFYEYRIDSQGE
ncbi:hypothetical protein PIB30_058403 [Stylosanthes scabra]|uniref:Uncharacterized protein n=1 Tax=Stylosanthes scabra TaxID=79078 RepID=A0ABU6RJW1_9FABA|nr:hypothetical protein [Stylosanthes scabra]